MRPAPPWRGAVALSVCVTTSWGILYYSFGVFLAFFQVDLGASKAVVGGAFSAALLTSAAISVPAGWAVDRLGARRVMTAAALLGVLAFALLAQVGSVAALYAVWILVGVAQAGALYEPAFAAVARWFPESAARSRALLILTSFGGFASTLYLPVAAWLCARYGWRDAALLLAALLAAITVPLSATLPRRDVAPPRATPDEPPPHAGVPRAAAVFTLQSFVSAGVAVHLVSHLVAGGRDLGAAAAMAGVMGAAQVPGRVLFAPFDRWVGARRRLPLLLVAQGAALAGIALLGGTPLVAAIALFGATNGMLTLERATLVAERWGVRHYGAVAGRIASFALAGRAAAPLAVALVADSAAAFLGLAAVLAAAAALGRPASWQRATP
jgi:predicted MFS family arabinose efflux permease